MNSDMGDGDLVDPAVQGIADDERVVSPDEEALIIPSSGDDVPERASEIDDITESIPRPEIPDLSDVEILAVLAEALLPVLDAAEAAYLNHPDEVGPLLNQMLAELKKHGLETLDLDGQPFDPEVAEAVAHQPGEGGQPVVAEVLRSGYRWKGRTLRPAMVRTQD